MMAQGRPRRRTCIHLVTHPFSTARPQPLRRSLARSPIVDRTVGRSTTIALKCVLWALVPAAALIELSRSTDAVFARNLVVDAGIIIILLTACKARGVPADLPLPRRRGLLPLGIASVALLATWPTLQLPYLADDWFLLGMRGQGGFLEAVSVREEEPWFRPAGWAFWWVFAKVSAVDATFARSVCLALFAICACLVLPALRRCGFPKGIAAAAALLFAVAPASLETVAWVTNLYSILACAFALGALATLPYRKYTFSRMAVPCLLATGAFLSKEDSYLLPVLAALAMARFRVRRIFDTGWRAWPFFVIVGVVATVRWHLLGGSGAYRNEQTGQSLLIQRMFYGPNVAIHTELPGRYFIPSRWNPYVTEKKMIWWAIPPAVIAWGGISAVARRGAWRGWALFALCIAPVAPLLPVGSMIECARWLFVPTIGIVAFIACCLAGGPLRGRLAWIPVFLFLALSWLVARKNLDAWSASGETLERCATLSEPFLRNVPHGGRVWAAGLPLSVQGAYCFNCAVPFLFHIRFGTAHAEFIDPSSGRGLLDAAFEVDARRNRAAELIRTEDAVELRPGMPWSVAGDEGIETATGVRIVNFINIWSPTGRLFKAGLNGYILLPPFRAHPGSNITIRLRGYMQSEDSEKTLPLLFCTMLTEQGYLRMPRKINEPFHLAEGSRMFRPEIVAPIGEFLFVENIEVSVD